MSKQKSQSFISIVIYIENNDKYLFNKINKIYEYLDYSYYDYEIILIVSKKNQILVANKIDIILKEIPSVRYLQISNNISNDIAYLVGIENAIGDFVILFNIETDPIICINEAVNMCKSGTDVIVGTSLSQSTIFYKLVRPFVNHLLNYIGYNLPKNATKFRCISRRAVNSVISIGHFYQNIYMQIQNSGYNFKLLNYNILKESKKTLYNGIKETLNLMVFNSFMPLRIMSMLGLFGSFISFIFTLYAFVIKFIKEDTVSGWASTASIISLLSFIQFIILAFISEYLARILIEQSHSDSYSIVFEKNSSIMVNQDRINVMKNSTDTSDINFVQTGRNK